MGKGVTLHPTLEIHVHGKEVGKGS